MLYNIWKSHWHYKSSSFFFNFIHNTHIYVTLVNKWRTLKWTNNVSFYMQIKSPQQRYPFFNHFFFKSSAFDFIIHHIEKYLSQTNFVDSKQFISHNVPFKRPRQFSFIPPFGSVGLQNKGEKGTDDPSWYDQFPSLHKSFPSTWINMNDESVRKM